jgi:hypothetical protein
MSAASPERPERQHLRLAGVAAVVLAAALLVASLAGAFGGGGTHPPRPRHPHAGNYHAVSPGAILEGPTQPSPPPAGKAVSVSVSLRATAGPVPADFMGLSFEAAAVPSLAGYAHGSNLVGLMRSLGGGVMRIGGLSSDKFVAFSPRGGAPSWANTVISSEDLAQLADLARETGWKVLLTLNVAHYAPATAAKEAALAKSVFAGDLLGVEIGNEPDRYVRDRLRAPGWGFPAYRREYEAYRQAIFKASPGVALVAPDASSGVSVLPWVQQTAAALHPALLTDHYYALTSCGGAHPSASQLLSPAVQRGENRVLARLARLAPLAHVGGAALRIDETNDISCHGEPGVSNSFASALWAVDWMARAMHAGVRGLNFHDLLAEPSSYSPLVLDSAAPANVAAGALAAARGGHPVPPRPLRANPKWYALLLASMLAGDTPTSSTVNGAPGLSAGAFRAPSGALHLVLVNLEPPSTHPLLVHLRAPGGFSGGSILALSAPSTSALDNVRLGGAEVDASGAWRPTAPLPRVYGPPRALALELKPASAALVTLPARAVPPASTSP